MTLILAYFILNEAAKCIEIVNMVVSFFGVLMIVYFSNSSAQAAVSAESASEGMYVFSVAINFFSAFVLALVVVLLKQLTTLHYSVLSGF